MEIDLLKNYPKAKRNLEERAKKTPEEVAIARRFDKEFFDGSRNTGYGGYKYDPKYWKPCIKDFVAHYKLKPGDSILDVGCAKGFMLYDFQEELSYVNVAGLDISDYAIKSAPVAIRPYLKQGDACNLPYFEKQFDLAISINTIHNLDLLHCERAIKEIQRVSHHQFIVVDAYRTDEEKKRMMDWNLTAQTIMSVDEWKIFFDACGYRGDYYWFIP